MLADGWCIARVMEESRVAQDFRQGATIRRDHGNGPLHRLEGRKAEALRPGGEQEYRSPAVPRLQLVLVHAAANDYPPVHVRRAPLECRVIVTGLANHYQRQPRRARIRPRIEQQTNVLARLGRTYVQRIRPIERAGGCRRPGWMEARVHHRDGLRVHTQVAANLPPTEFGDGHEAIRIVSASSYGPRRVAGEQTPIRARSRQKVDVENGHQLRDTASSGGIAGRHGESVRPTPFRESPDAEVTPPLLAGHVDGPEEKAIADPTRSVGSFQVKSRDLGKRVHEAIHPARGAGVGAPEHGCVNDHPHKSACLSARPDAWVLRPGLAWTPE